MDSGGDTGDYTSIALNSNNYPHISYQDYNNGMHVKYARWTGSAWNITTVDSGYSGTSMALDSNRLAYISYQNTAGLKFAKRNASEWNIQTVDSTGNYRSPSIALDSNNNPHIGYVDFSNSYLKYAFLMDAVSAPTFSPLGGSYSSPQYVKIRCDTDGATITYTIDGSEPSSSSAMYVGSIKVSVNTTIKAKAFKSGMADSDTVSATFTINTPPGKVATPTFSLSGGTYSSPPNIVLSCSTSGATIRYTTDGSEPSSTSTVYTNPIPISSGSVTVKAKAFKNGVADSFAAEATYTINQQSNVLPPEAIYAIAAAVAVSVVFLFMFLFVRRRKSLSRHITYPPPQAPLKQ